jgi:hypothetical protein
VAGYGAWRTRDFPASDLCQPDDLREHVGDVQVQNMFVMGEPVPEYVYRLYQVLDLLPDLAMLKVGEGYVDGRAPEGAVIGTK